jgi:hypothetical protein
MDDARAARFARELAEAIAEAIAGDPHVAACRDRARAAGIEFRVSLDAVDPSGLDQVEASLAPSLPLATTRLTPAGAGKRWTRDITSADRRFLKSLRIAADESKDAAS